MPVHLQSTLVSDLLVLQEGWANYVRQGSGMPDTLRDIAPAAMQASLDAHGAATKVGPAGRVERHAAALVFAVLRDSRHLAMGSRSSLVAGINGRIRGCYDLGVSSLSAGTGGVS